MRILIVAPVPPDPAGAGAIPILLHTELLALAARNEITLVTSIGNEPGEEDAVRSLTEAGYDVKAADRRPPARMAARWQRRAKMAIAWARGVPWRTVWFADPGIQPIIDGLASVEFDLALVEDSAMAGYRLPAGATTVLTEHEVLRPRPMSWQAGGPSMWLSWAFRELDWRRRVRCQTAAWTRFDRVVAFTKRDAVEIAKRAPGVATRVRISPFGLEIPALADPSRERPDTILFVGNFTHQPNRDAAQWLAEEILPALRRLRPHARLSLMGYSPPRSVRELAGPGVDLIADPSNVASEMQAAAVVVAPVRTGGGMRMKILEALAAGKAVVTTSRGTEGFDCLEGPPPLSVADDGESFAAMAAALLQDTESRQELGRRARTFVERHYSPEAWAERLESIFDEARGDV